MSILRIERLFGFQYRTNVPFSQSSPDRGAAAAVRRSGRREHAILPGPRVRTHTAARRRSPRRRGGADRVDASCLQENLQRALAQVSRAVATKTTMPILGNVLIAADEERLKLSATNL